MVLKILSKQQKKSMTRIAHDVFIIYLGYQHGVNDGEIAYLEAKLLLMAEGYKKAKAESKLYKDRSGQIEA